MDRNGDKLDADEIKQGVRAMISRTSYVPGLLREVLLIVAVVLFVIVGLAWAVPFALPAPNAWLAFGLASFAAAFI